jgi:phosphate transporter
MDPPSPPTPKITADLFSSLDFDHSSLAQTSTSAPSIRLTNRTTFLPITAAIIFSILYSLPIIQSHPTVHSTLAILVFVTFLWATEGFPVYATAYMVPVLAVWLGVGLGPDGKRLDATSRAQQFAHPFMDPMIFVYLGCMTMSEALCKLNIADRFANLVFKHLPAKPRWMLLALMLLNLGVSSFLSPTASTSIILTFTQPIIRSLDPDDPFAKALLFGLAWSGNCGGMSTWIAEPQNLIALDTLSASGETVPLINWIAFGVPTALLVCLTDWVYLCFRFKPLCEEVPIPGPFVDYEHWALKHTFTCMVVVGTVLLWMLHPLFAEQLGDIGITSLVPVIAFFGSKLLTIEDFKRVRWPTLSLMGGGLAIREAMSVSNFLAVMRDSWGPAFGAIPAYPLLLIVLILTCFLASCMNSTVAAAILLPLIAVAASPQKQVRVFVCLSALMVSGAQLFDLSTFANSLISGVRKHVPGNPQALSPERFLTKGDFPRYAWPTVLATVAYIASIGYGIVYGIDRVLDKP